MKNGRVFRRAVQTGRKDTDVMSGGVDLAGILA